MATRKTSRCSSDAKFIKQEVSQEVDAEHAQYEKSIRRQVEADFEKRDAERVLGSQSLASKQATMSVEEFEKFKHIHPHLTDNYVKSFYVNAGNDDAICSVRRSS